MSDSNGTHKSPQPAPKVEEVDVVVIKSDGGDSASNGRIK